MILSKKAIQEFLHAGSAIQQNNVLPILSNVCFREGRAIKTNLREFISMPFTHEFDVVIDERLLSNFVSYSSGDSIKVTVSGKTLTMSDDSGASMKCDNINVSEYPVISIPAGQPFFLSKEFFQQMNIASKFTGKDMLKPQFDAVYVKDGKIGGTDSWVMYYADVDKNIPEMILSKAACRLFSDIDVANGYQNANFYFAITATGTMYGAIKTELNYLNLASVIPGSLPVGVPVNSQEVIRFNSAAMTAAPGKYPIYTLSGGMHIEMNDTDQNIDFKTDIPMPGVDLQPFRYTPSLLNRALSAIPNLENTWAQGSNRQLYISSPGYVCIIMGMVIN